MSTIYYSVIVGFFGLLATLSAFGGDTWANGSQPLYKRITVRGWVSLASLLLAFGFGSYKDIRQNRENDEYNSLLASKKDLEIVLQRQAQNLLATNEKLESTQLQLEKAIAGLERRKINISEYINNASGLYSYQNIGEMPINVASVDEYSIFTFKVNESSPRFNGIKQYTFATIGYPFHVDNYRPEMVPWGQPIYSFWKHKYQKILREVVEEVETDANGDINVIEATHELCVTASYRDEEGGSYVLNKHFRISPLPKIDTAPDVLDYEPATECNLSDFRNRVNELQSIGRIYRPAHPVSNGCGFQWRLSCAIMVDFAHGIERWKEIHDEGGRF